ncbi:DEAD/DEAH box helicase [uncultured Bacteroides sp.]|uniref:DEAD/DEAH box helicase n=1 Tax=uncultured Bacteroides sp. TaxID=162156 RepID=UPI002AABF319|nr:DEAD/DEAH box helicase [uncultured Bacteroides sp.]
MVTLRPYQTEGIRDIFDAWNPQTQNLMNVLFQMPTGTGKTTVFSEIVRRARLKQKQVLIVVHRKELVEQIAERLAHFQVDAGIISGSIKPDKDKAVQVATIQTLSKRDYPDADIVIIDECHHAKAETYKKLWNIYPDARFLGVTATPIRMNGEGFSDLFDILINSGKLSDFIKKNYLVKVRHIVGISPDLSEVKVKMNDYVQNELGEIMQNEQLMADLVDSYQREAAGKKMIVFAVNIEHSKLVAKQYNEAGICAEHIDANTPKQDRERILQLFKDGEISVLSNVDIVSEGFDVPDCEAVQLARPTKSLALYLQQIGRCMRPARGKQYGIVLDNAGLWLEHGFCQQDRQWTLEGNKRRKYQCFSPKVAAFNAEGIVRRANIPQQIEGMELVQLTSEIADLIIFEDYLKQALNIGHKSLHAYYRFREYLEEQDKTPNLIHLAYIEKRISKLPEAPAKGFWYHQRKELELV